MAYLGVQIALSRAKILIYSLRVNETVHSKRFVLIKSHKGCRVHHRNSAMLSQQPPQDEERFLILRACDAAIVAQHKLFAARLKHDCTGGTKENSKELHEAILESKEAINKVRSALSGHNVSCFTS